MGLGWDAKKSSVGLLKGMYLACMLFNALRTQISTDIAFSVVRDWVGVNLTESEYGGILLPHPKIL